MPDARNSRTVLIKNMSENHPEWIHVCERNGRVVGFIMFNLDYERKLASINSNASDPLAGEKGVGHEMYTFALDFSLSESKYEETEEITPTETENTVDLSLIELKDEKVYESIISQLEGYIIWLKDYIIPHYLRQNKKVNIHPVIVSDGIENSRQSTKDKLKVVEQNIVNFNWSKHNQTNITVYPAKIIHFSIENNKITLKK